MIPKRSGIHRYACLALYRALLSESKAVKGRSPGFQTVESLVRAQFRKLRVLQSPSQIANALKAGYEALDLIHSAHHGNEHDVCRLSRLVSEQQQLRANRIATQRALSQGRPPKPVSKKRKKRLEEIQFQKSTAARHPEATSILARPRPVVPGRRRIPVLVSARGVPFLRIKKPQPKILSDVIRSKLKRRWSLVERRDRLKIDILFAEDEQSWDLLLQCTEPLEAEERSWGFWAQHCLGKTNWLINELDRRNMELAEAMWRVVMAERELAMKEQEEEKRSRPQTG